MLSLKAALSNPILLCPCARTPGLTRRLTKRGERMSSLKGAPWFERVRASKLSTRAIYLFSLAFVLPWCVDAWLTSSDRSVEVSRIERNLARLASAYDEHAATLVNRGMAQEALDADLAEFSHALNSGVQFSLRKTEPGSGDSIARTYVEKDGMISAEVGRPAAGIA